MPDKSVTKSQAKTIVDTVEVIPSDKRNKTLFPGLTLMSSSAQLNEAKKYCVSAIEQLQENAWLTQATYACFDVQKIFTLGVGT